MGGFAEDIEVRFKGLAISPGVALGRAALLATDPSGRVWVSSLATQSPDFEKTRLLRAIEKATEHLDEMVADVTERVGLAEAMIFKVQQAILNDPDLTRQIVERIVSEHVTAESAATEVLDVYESEIRQLDSEYARDRGSDITEVGQRLLDALAEGNLPTVAAPSRENGRETRNAIVVAEELTPGVTVRFDRTQTFGFVTEHGGRTSHGAILARAMRVPAVSGVPGISRHVSPGAEILVDGNTGEVIVWPNEQTLDRYHNVRTAAARVVEPVAPVASLTVMANINLATDTDEAVTMMAEGIGLYRTEFEFLAAGRILNEDEQYERYASVLQAMDGKPVYFRLLDIGGDKGAEFFDLPREDNPYLGFRGSRLLLARGDLMRPQARALARASAHGTVHVMYPMVTELEQFEKLKWLFCEEIGNRAKGRIYHGVMLEVPAACMQARELLAAADFGSIGTNDLIQYLYAIDRNNEHVAYDYSPDKAMFLQMIQHIVQAAKETRRPLSVCGEAASRTRFLPKLMDIGINTVSVSPRLIPDLRRSVNERPS